MPIDDKTAGGNALKGVLFVLLSSFLFAVSDVLNKTLVTTYSVSFVLAGRYLVNLGLMVTIMGPRHGSQLWKTQRTVWVVMRGVILAASSLTMGFALQRMPVAETVAIIYLTPFMVMLLSGPLLHEKVHPAAWFGAVLAFSGVMLVLRPGGGLDPVGVTFALANAGLSTAYQLVTRVLARTESTMSMLFHVALVGSVVFCVLATQTLPDTLPSVTEFAMIGALGVLSTGGHFLFTIACREASPALLSPVNYTHLVWVSLLAWAVFGHIPQPLTLLGMAIVLLAGVGLAIGASRGH